MPIVTRTPLLRGGGSSALIALTTLRRAGIPVPGLGVAAAPKRKGAPVRLSGMGRTVQHNFFGQMITYAGAEDIIAQQAQDWQSRRGNDTGYACPDLQLDPSLAVSRLLSLVADHCGLAPEACSGVDVPGVAAGAAQQYAAWFASAFPKGWGDCYNYDAATFAAKFPGANRADYWQGGSPGGYVPDTYPGTAGGGNQTGYTIPNTVTPTFGTNPPSAGSTGANTGGGGSMSTPPASSTGNGPSGPVVLTLRNTSRPNMPLASGDSFELAITGSPYSPVKIDATRNGSQRGVSEVGNTDGQGLKIMSGRMSNSEVGSWVEVISVGNSTATISFSVGAAPGVTQGGGPAATGSGPTTGGGGATATGVTPIPMPMPEGVIVSGLPSWAIPAAIAAVAVFMLRK